MSKFVMTIFGASGDLTKRKLMPALYSLYVAKRLPEEFEILGVGRTVYEDADYRTYIYNEMEKFVKSEEQNKEKMDAFVGHLHYLAIDPALESGYGQLRLRIEELSGDSRPDDLLFYLATPPSLYGVIPLHLKSVHLNKGRARIIVEKPFGYDLESAEKLNKIYASVFDEHQIYRIDHFLGKETAQNLLAFRFANGIFEPLWNRNYIDYVEVTAVENLGIEQRGGFYDTTGALRDMVQNHLIQLVALTAMEPPAVFNADNFRNEVVKVYESLTPLTETDLSEHIVRGQYTAGGNKRGYREEKNISPDSRTETYIAMKLGISNWRWSRVPFYIRTGKQMPTKVTEIVVHFRETPHQMFIPITQNRIEEMPGCFYCITPCKEGLVAQDTVFYQTGIGISAGDAPQLIITEIHRSCLTSNPGPGTFMPNFNTIPSLGCKRNISLLALGQLPPAQWNI